MIDIHAHFTGEVSDFPAEWAKIKAAGVTRVILAGDNLKNSEVHAKLANCADGCYFTVGIHPESADRFPDSAEIARFRALAEEEKCVAVGEIGLDHHYPGYDAAAQRKLFEFQLDLADELCLPVQIHSRDACAETLEILRKHTPVCGFVMHCYSYGAENLDAFLSLGGYFSFGGTVCFHNAKKNVASAEKCPLARMLTETDSPYLSPYRGMKNSPSNIPVIAARLAEIKHLSVEDLTAAVDENAERLFEKL